MDHALVLVLLLCLESFKDRISKGISAGIHANQMNFFIEKFSNDEYQTLGGPFRAVSEGCDYYVYIFKKPCRIFILDAKKLLEKVNRLIETNHFPKKLIPNRNYKTSGYALPISALMSCIVSEDKSKSGVKNNH